MSRMLDARSGPGRGRPLAYTELCNGAAQTSAAIRRAPPPRFRRTADQRPDGARHVAARRAAAAPGRVHGRPAAAAAGADAAAGIRHADRGAAGPRAGPQVSGPLARLGRRARRDLVGRRSSSSSTTTSRRPTPSPPSIPGRGKVQLQNLVVVVQRRVAAHDRDHRAPRQRRPGSRRQRQRVRDRGSDRARARLRALGGHRRRSSLRRRPITLVFVSTDGGAFGALGAARFAQTSAYRNDADAVISLDAHRRRAARRGC